MNKVKCAKPSVSINTNKSNIREKPSFSFEYLTTNNNYNFKYFTDRNAEQTVKAVLLDRIVEVSCETWLHWQSLPKAQGIETMKANDIKITPHNMTFSNDEKVVIMRFGKSKDYRLIGFKKDTTFYVIGFDFNYSAYNHGS